MATSQVNRRGMHVVAACSRYAVRPAGGIVVGSHRRFSRCLRLFFDLRRRHKSLFFSRISRIFPRSRSRSVPESLHRLSRAVFREFRAPSRLIRSKLLAKLATFCCAFRAPLIVKMGKALQVVVQCTKSQFAVKDRFSATVCHVVVVHAPVAVVALVDARYMPQRNQTLVEVRCSLTIPARLKIGGLLSGLMLATRRLLLPFLRSSSR